MKIFLLALSLSVLALAQNPPSGGAVSSVTGAGTVSCTPTTGNVTCTGSGGSSVSVTAADSSIVISPSPGTGTFTTGVGTVPLTKLATQADQTVVGNVSGGTAVPSALTATQVRTLIGYPDPANIICPSGTTGTPGSTTLLNGACVWETVTAPPASAALLGSDSSQNPIAVTPHAVATILACVSASASSTNYTCATTPTFTPANGDIVLWRPDVTNTGNNSTLNVNSQGAKNLKVQNTSISGVTAAQLVNGQAYLVIYDGTAWELMSALAVLQGPNGYFTADGNGQATMAQAAMTQSAGSTNIWQTFAPASKRVGIMADHVYSWGNTTTGSIFGGSFDTGISRLAAGAVGIGNGTQGTFSATLQAGVTATDPGCTTTSHVGKQWFDITTTTTVYKVCLNVAGTLTWVTK